MLQFQKENGSPGVFPYSVYCSLIVQTEVCHLFFVDEEANGSYPFANVLNGLTNLCVIVASHDRISQSKVANSAYDVNVLRLSWPISIYSTGVRCYF